MSDLPPVEPGPQWHPTRRLQHRELRALYEARARRRAGIWGIPRVWIGEGLWAAGTVAATRVAATIALARRVVQDRGYDGLEWSEWQEILTDNDDPPEVCEQFALGLADHGCVEDCSLPPRGRVRCLRPRGEALARLIANGPVD